MVSWTVYTKSINVFFALYKSEEIMLHRYPQIESIKHLQKTRDLQRQQALAEQSEEKFNE